MEEDQGRREKERIRGRERRKNVVKDLRYKAATVYHGIWLRCNSKKRKDYPRYGGRGIQLRISRQEFIEWYLREAKGRTDLTVDRQRNDGHYEFGNLQLLTAVENSAKEYQARATVRKNRFARRGKESRNGRSVEVGGIVYRSMTEASMALGKERSTVSKALKRGFKVAGLMVRSL